MTKKSPKPAKRARKVKAEARRPVCIVAMGNSHVSYMHMSLLDAMRPRIADHDVWAINTMGTVIQCDRIMHIDPLGDYADGFTLKHGSQTAAYHDVSKGDVVMPPDPIMAKRYMETKVPIYTGIVDKRFKSSVRYPIEEIVDYFKFPYFNSCVAYAVALAIYEQRPEIWMFGCDYSYPNTNVGEAGRACTEYWLGQAVARKIKVVAAGHCVLLDNWQERRVLYGYGERTWEEVRDAPNK